MKGGVSLHNLSISLPTEDLFISSVFMTTNTVYRWPNIVVKVKNRQVVKLAKSASYYYYYYYFPDKSFFCLLNNHNDSSTIPIAFIVKFWS